VGGRIHRGFIAPCYVAAAGVTGLPKVRNFSRLRWSPVALFWAGPSLYLFLAPPSTVGAWRYRTGAMRPLIEAEELTPPRAALCRLLWASGITGGAAPLLLVVRHLGRFSRL
jgi:hypothetical protein